MYDKYVHIFGSSHSEVFCKKGVLRNLTKFTGKHLCQSLFFNKVAGLRPATLLKKRLWHKCFPVNFVKFLRTPFFIEHLWWLLLYIVLFTCQIVAHSVASLQLALASKSLNKEHYFWLSWTTCLEKVHGAMFHVKHQSYRITSSLRGKTEKGRYLFKLGVIMQLVHG